jgi:hypothetical protein
MPTNLPTFGFTFTNASGGMNFTSPVVITSPPGETNRLFIVEKTGAIVVKRLIYNSTTNSAPSRHYFPPPACSPI